MKNVFTIIFCLLCSVLLFSNPVSGYEIQIEDELIAMKTNYFDYSISTPNGVAIRNQPDDVGGGTNFVFHAKETGASTLRTYYSYMDADGNLTNTATISTDAIEESFPSLDIDQ